MGLDSREEMFLRPAKAVVAAAALLGACGPQGAPPAPRVRSVPMTEGALRAAEERDRVRACEAAKAEVQQRRAEDQAIFGVEPSDSEPSEEEKRLRKMREEDDAFAIQRACER